MITSQWPDVLDPHPYKIAPNANSTKSAVVKGLSKDVQLVIKTGKRWNKITKYSCNDSEIHRMFK